MGVAGEVEVVAIPVPVTVAVAVVVAGSVTVAVKVPGLPPPLVQRPFSHEVPAGHGSSGPHTAFPPEPTMQARLDPSVTHSRSLRIHSSGRMVVVDATEVVVTVKVGTAVVGISVDAPMSEVDADAVNVMIVVLGTSSVLV